MIRRPACRFRSAGLPGFLKAALTVSALHPRDFMIYLEGLASG
jgi:hypothetical protein